LLSNDKNELEIPAIPLRSEILSLNLFNKQNYVCSHRLLKYMSTLGMKVVKIKFVLQFREATFLKEYINYYTTKRNEKKMR